MKLRFLLGLGVVLMLAMSSASAFADPSVGPTICPGAETAISGSYKNLTITGNSYVDSSATLAVSGNLTLAPGACLDAFTMGTVTVGHNVKVGKGAILALGCTTRSLDPNEFPQSPCTGTTNDEVGGNIDANQPLTMYLDGNTIHGNVTSNGGGPGLDGLYTNFPIKDNSIGGNLQVQGWQGAWVGVVRNDVGGNVIFSKNASKQDLDSNEVQTNQIGGNLICQGNTPAAQVNASDGGQLNTVSGNKIGQCASL